MTPTPSMCAYLFAVHSLYETRKRYHQEEPVRETAMSVVPIGSLTLFFLPFPSVSPDYYTIELGERFSGSGEDGKTR